MIPLPYKLIAYAVALAVAYGSGVAMEKHFGDARLAALAANYQRDLDQQKVEAANILSEANARIVALQAARDQYKDQLEQEHAKREIEIDNVRRDYAKRIAAAGGLRVTGAVVAAGGSGAGPVPGAANAAGDAGTATVQLPEETTRDLQDLARDADQLRNDYQQCYDYVNGIGKVK